MKTDGVIRGVNIGHVLLLSIFCSCWIAPLAADNNAGKPAVNLTTDRDAVAEGSQNVKRRPSLEPIEDNPKLPRVLLLGDSISIGYTVPVRKELAEVANVHRPPENCGSTVDGLNKINKWLGTGKWDVIHFNWGLHDLKYLTNDQQNVSPEIYEQNLRKLVTILKETKAVLVWCSTTPVPAYCTEGYKRIPGDIAVYNRIAEKIMQENGILIDDLYTCALPKMEEIQRPQNVHFSEAGSQYLGQKVSQSIRTALESAGH